jgi:hypothetical protein
LENNQFKLLKNKPFMEKIKYITNHKFFQTIIVFLFFSFFGLIGVSIYDDYGISWDETQQRLIGTENYKYVFEGNNDLLTFKDKDYGVGVELPLIIIEKVLKLEDTRDIYLMRHFVNFLLFFIGTIFFYLLCREHFGNYKSALLATTFLILSPRIFADAFYNSKDLTFLSVYIISIYSLKKFIDKTTVPWAIIHGIVCAFLINIRIMGIIIVILTVLFTILLYFKGKKENVKKISIIGTTYIVSFISFLVVTWPYLWESPLLNFYQAFVIMSRFIRFDGYILAWGQNLHSTALPWYYVPGWIFFTTPLLYTITFIAGVLYSFNLILDINPELLINNPEKRNNLVFLCCFFIPLMAVILFHSVLYMGWRHMYYIYPMFIIFSVTGVHKLLNFIK